MTVTIKNQINQKKKIEQIKELVSNLNEASDKYYNSTPIMSDYEWDQLYNELSSLEKETGIIYPNSPTQNVGYKVLDNIPKIKHNHPMLSLDKCHSAEELIAFAKEDRCILSVKADGLTVSLRYLDGKLISAETRGDGVTGSDVLENVKTISNVPQEIPYKEELIIDGECIIGWDKFREINDSLPTNQEKYKHPRNLVSGTLTQFDTKIAAERQMRFIAWRVIKGFVDKTSVADKLIEICLLGFETIPFLYYCNSGIFYSYNRGILTELNYMNDILEEIRFIADRKNIPYDGAVLAVDNIELAESLGRTEKFFRHSIAYKYEDELYKTRLTNIEWNVSKTGLINPVAIFEPVDLDGAVTTRATLHNISYIENLQLGIGDTIRVYRANAVIPKVHDNLTRSNTWKLPDKCPCCGGEVKVDQTNESKVLLCTNPDCDEKKIAKLVHFVSRDAINIDGLSEETIRKLYKKGYLKEYTDIFELKNYSDELKKIEGFGKKSIDKLIKAIEESKNTTLERFIYSLSIPLIGKTASKQIAKICDYNILNFLKLIYYEDKELYKIDGFGESMYLSFKNYFYYFDNIVNVVKISEISDFQFKEPQKVELNNSNSLNGLIFAITGSLELYKNRNELISVIENYGGKVSNSVSSKTNYLINNDVNSNSSKNKKAKELNVRIITEKEFEKMIK